MRSSLFLKIYLTLLASLAVVAIVSALFVRLGDDERDRGWRGRRDAFIVAMLPPEATPGDQQIVIDRLADALRADIALYDSSGRLVAAAGRPLPPDIIDRWNHGGPHGGPHLFVTRLPDGRFVAARTDFPLGPGGRGTLAWLVFIAAAIGFAAYPVVRHLTRRLEKLRHGVERWGSGALSTRVGLTGTDEVAAVAATFDKAADRIERMIEAHRALLANASHELRSPLARLRMAIDLFEHAPDDKTKHEIVQNLGELDTLVEEILLASRLDHAEGLERVEPVDLLALAAEEGARNGIRVGGTAVIVDGDPKLLTRLMRNLMQNALRHGAPPVVTEVLSDGNTASFAIRDHGAGLPDGEGERVFEPFYRPSARGESAGGWGLGLSLVRQIATHHGATVRYEEPEGGGARFVVTFPISEMTSHLTGRAPA